MLLQFKIWRNKLTVHLIIKSKKPYYKKRLTENVNNPRGLWKILKNVFPSNTSPSPTIATLIINDQEIVDPKEIGDLFNSYFSSIYY